VHVHILPRGERGPYSQDKEAMYPALETSEEGLHGDLVARSGAGVSGTSRMVVQKDEDRRSRTDADMETEADWLRSFF
jgi:bis(5'-adenosyl)-triphosphatase